MQQARKKQNNLAIFTIKIYSQGIKINKKIIHMDIYIDFHFKIKFLSVDSSSKRTIQFPLVFSFENDQQYFERF